MGTRPAQPPTPDPPPGPPAVPLWARWHVWQLPRGPLTWLLIVETVTAVLVLRDIAAAAGVTGGAPVVSVLGLTIAGGHSAALIAAVLAVVGSVHAELDAAALRRERAQFSRISTFDFLAVWTFGAALLLPPILFVPTIAFVHFHMWWRVAKVRMRFYRSAFNGATVLLAGYAAHAVVATLGAGDPTTLIHTGPIIDGAVPGWLVAALGYVPVVVPALIAYTVVNQGLVMAMIALAVSDVDRATLLGSAEDNAMEIATLLLGAGTAALVVQSPALLILLPGPLLIVQRLAVARRLQHAATIDAKTGLLTYDAWHDQVGRLLLSAHPSRWALLTGRAARTTSRPGSRPTDRRATRRGGRHGGRHDVARRPGTPVGVLMVDIDHFKTINDTWGHHAGDEVLLQVAQRLRIGVRLHDLIGRFGGEEFAVLLRGPRQTGMRINREATVIAIAERIRTTIADTQFTIDTPDGPITITRQTVSVGAVVLPPGTTDDQLEAFTRLADSALYASKRAGRDCVHLAEDIHDHDQGGEHDTGGDVGDRAVGHDVDTVPQAMIDLEHAPTVPLPIIAGAPTAPTLPL